MKRLAVIKAEDSLNAEQLNIFKSKWCAVLRECQMAAGSAGFRAGMSLYLTSTSQDSIVIEEQVYARMTIENEGETLREYFKSMCQRVVSLSNTN